MGGQENVGAPMFQTIWEMGPEGVRDGIEWGGWDEVVEGQALVCIVCMT